MSVPTAIPLRYAVRPVEPGVVGAAMQDIEDNELAKLARKDELAFEEIVRRYYQDVYRICAYFTRDREEAWDLAQDTFIRAHGAIGTFRGEANVKTWLLRIASNRAKDHLKKRRLKTVPLEPWHADRVGQRDENPETLAHDEELGRAIQAGLEQLSPKHRMAITLREFEGLSYEEMAAVMKCRVGTVMSRLFHARRYLRQYLEEHGYWEGTSV